MSDLYVEVLGDKFLVGSFKSGTDMLQNMYGMYLSMEFEPIQSNINTAVHGTDLGWNRLHSTHLGFSILEDRHTVGSLVGGTLQGTVSTSDIIRVKRDYKDVLVHCWREHSPEMTWDDFIKSSMGYSLVQAFETSQRVLTYNGVIKYENLVNDPQKVLTALVDKMSPRWVNGTNVIKQTTVNLRTIEKVIEGSKIRELRQNPDSMYLEKVGVYAEWITPEQAEHVDAFVASL